MNDYLWHECTNCVCACQMELARMDLKKSILELARTSAPDFHRHYITNLLFLRKTESLGGTNLCQLLYTVWFGKSFPVYLKGKHTLRLWFVEDNHWNSQRHTYTLPTISICAWWRHFLFAFCIIGKLYLKSVLASFMSAWHKIELSERWEAQLRKCIHNIQLQGVFSTSDWSGRA